MIALCSYGDVSDILAGNFTQILRERVHEKWTRTCKVLYRWSTSPPMSQNCSRQEKKVDIKAFFFFFLRLSNKLGGFVTKSVPFLFKYRQNLLKINRISRRQPVSRFLLFIFFLRRKEKTSVGIRRPQNILSMALCKTIFFCYQYNQ